MTDFNERVLARLEERWLDPDCVDEPRDEEEEWEEADRRYAERCLDRQ